MKIYKQNSSLLTSSPFFDLFKDKMKNSSFIVYAIIAYLITFSGCKRDTCADFVTQYDTLNLPLHKVPYTGYDVLYFSNKQGDTCIVQGTGKKCSYDIVTEANGAGCDGPEKVTYYQTCTIHFKPLKGDMEFEIVQTRQSTSIQIDLINDMYNDPYFEIDYDQLGVRQNYKDEYYSDSLTINSKNYHTVYKTLVLKGGIVIDDTTYKCFINHTEGILSLKSEKDNKEYTIINRP